MSVCSLINIKQLSFESVGMGIHTVTCLTVLVCIFVFPVLMIGYLILNFKRLNNRIIKRKFGKMYDELDIDGSKAVLV